jgi:hypothetical protein
VRVAFLGYDQPADASVRPAGGYISKSEADALVRTLAAEPISQKRIRAFPPGTAFRNLSSRNLCFIPPRRLPSGEIPGLRFVPPHTDRRPRPAAIRAGWDWSQEREKFFNRVSAGSPAFHLESAQRTSVPHTVASGLLAGSIG